jgi:ABC-2 type transport system ATP-binding protein
VLCTHNLEEADRLCDRIGIFKHKLIVADTTVNLRRRLFGREQMFRLRRMERSWVIAVGELDFVQQARAAGNVLYVRLEHPEEHNPLIVRRLVELNAELQYIGEVTHSLEEIYLQLLNEADGPGN